MNPNRRCIEEERRIGRFYYNPYVVMDEDLIKVVFEGIAPLRAECLLARNGEVEVDAWCEEFDITEIGESIPTYTFLIETITDDDGKVTGYKRTIRRE